MNYTVRYATENDLERIEQIYSGARQFMQQTGNPSQWGKQYPPHNQLKQDIRDKSLYVIADENGIHGVFYFYIGEDPTYQEISEGNWRSNEPYGTIHRIAGDGSGGILKEAVHYAQKQISHLRIDTHHDNHVMQKALARQGFHRCGIIYIEDGTPRIAYDRFNQV